MEVYLTKRAMSERPKRHLQRVFPPAFLPALSALTAVAAGGGGGGGGGGAPMPALGGGRLSNVENNQLQDR